MDSKQEAFLRELLADFKVEAAEHHQAIVNGLIALENGVDEGVQKPLIETVFREMHSLKGAARAVNLLEIERLCQYVESVFHALKEGKVTLSADLLDPVFKAVDMLQTMLQEIGSTQKTTGSSALKAIQEKLDRCLKPFSGKTPSVFPEPPAIPSPSLTSEEIIQPVSVAVSSPDTVRISTARLNALFSQAENFISAKATLKSYLKELGEIPGQHESLFRLYTDMSKYERSFSRLIDSFTTEIKTILLHPFSSVLEMMPKLVRDLAREQGKEISLEITGKETEIDRRILEEIKDPLIHLVRNCIDHGLEKPGIRRAAGKPEKGLLTIAIRQEANQQVIIRISDDGQGIQTSPLLATAIRKGIITEEMGSVLPEADIHALIFRSGISTGQYITDLSGRGLGMAIVAEKVVNLGGFVTVESVNGEGTTFNITLPLTLSTFHGIPVKIQDQLFIIPTTTIIQAIRVKPATIQTIDGKPVIPYQQTLIGICSLQEILGLPVKTQKKAEVRYLPVLIVGTTAQKLALVVDEILGEQESIVKDITPVLGKVRNISGATILGNGRIVLVLNMVDIIEKAITTEAGSRSLSLLEETEAHHERAQRILVAEDSLTARSLIKNILESEGFHVTTTVDGAEAFTLLQHDTYDLIVSDVEMPRMNGFELTARIRAHDLHHDLPVILVTALETADDRQRGLEAGANAYINKSSFEQQHLLETIHLLI